MSKIRDDQLLPLAAYLLDWLRREMDENPATPSLTESRARALFYATQTLDEPSVGDFQRRLQEPGLLRVALSSLLESAGLAGVPAMEALPAALAAVSAPAGVAWLSLAMTAYAWKYGYNPAQLDPAAPPTPFSPAGQIVQQAAQFIRRLAQISPTERDRLAQRLAFDGRHVPSLEELPPPAQTLAPLPPHFRPPIPVRYPEYNEPVTIRPEEASTAPPDVVVSGRLVISPEDLPREPTPEPPIHIEATRPAPAPEIKVGTPRPAPPVHTRRVLSVADVTRAVSDMAAAVGRRFSQEPLKTTRLRVVVQTNPDGVGLPGLQVKVRCEGVSKYVAATTNPEGVFHCELPVREQSGLTYHVDVTWPPEYGGKTERKSITLNAERTEFTLPFYHRLKV